MEFAHGSNWPTRQALYSGIAGRAGRTNQRTGAAAATQQGASQPCTSHPTGAHASRVADVAAFLYVNGEELADTLKHEGIRAGEIIAYRAWRVISAGLFRSRDELLHSVYMRDYVWLPGEPASGDVKTHGIYSFRHAIRSKQDYSYNAYGVLLFGKIKIWGEVVEHEAGYRSEFGKIISLDYGPPELLDKFRKIYGVNLGRGTSEPS
jgi:hypothetical protein